MLQVGFCIGASQDPEKQFPVLSHSLSSFHHHPPQVTLTDLLSVLQVGGFRHDKKITKGRKQATSFLMPPMQNQPHARGNRSSFLLLTPEHAALADLCSWQCCKAGKGQDLRAAGSPEARGEREDISCLVGKVEFDTERTAAGLAREGSLHGAPCTT